MKNKIPLIVIVGPTSCGKTKLSIAMAKEFNAEIISADSMQVYREMDIATAKPTIQEMQGIPHHMIDILDCNQSFNVSDYVKLAKDKIYNIYSSNKLPILVGGTGLYINSLIDNINFNSNNSDDNIRNELIEQFKKYGIDTLYNQLKSIDPLICKKIHPNNVTRVIRALEIYKVTGITMSEHNINSRKNPSEYNLCIIGLNYRDRNLLYQNIDKRVDKMIKDGLIIEARKILSKYDIKTSYQAIGYKELRPYFEDGVDLEHCIYKIKQETRRYSKRQITWFKKDNRIKWLYADEYIEFSNIFKKARKIIENFVNICYNH